MKKIVSLLSLISVIFILFLLTPLYLSNLLVYAQDTSIITEFSISTGWNDPAGITAGSDGNVWFTERSIDKIGRVTPDGNFAEFNIANTRSFPGIITLGPDGNVWFGEPFRNSVGKITPNGIVTEFPVPSTGPNTSVGDVAAGPDGNIWSLDSNSNSINKITLNDGSVTNFPVPTSNSGLARITSGADGNLWFTEYYANKIGRITPRGQVTEFAVPTNNAGLNGITLGSDGNVWFTESYKIGRVTPQGVFTEFSVPQNYGAPFNITSGPDGNIWYIRINGNNIGRITPQGIVREFQIPTNDSNPEGITAGPDGNIWFTENRANKIARVNINNISEINIKDYKQTDPQWSTLPSLPANANTHLDHSLNCGDMYLFGCAVTSVADVFYSYGKTSLLNLQLNPGTLNDWLTNNKAFNSCSIIWPNLSSASDFGAPNVLFSGSPKWSTSSQTIDAALAVGNLPIVGVYTIYGTHFIVLSSKLPDVNGKPDYRIVDPALYPFSANVIGKTGQALSQAYGGWDNVFQYVIYKKDSAKQRTLTIQAHSPVQLVITDPFGNVTGYDSTTQQTVENIPDSSYGVEPGIAPVDGSAPPMEETKYFQQIDPTEGDYELQVVGTGNGNYNLDLSKTDENGNVSIATVNGIAQQGITENYQVDYIPNATDPVITKKEVTFDSLQSDLKGLYIQEEIKNKGIYVALKVETEAAERASNIDKQPLGNKLAIAALKAIQFELKIYRGRQITEDAYQLLFTDIDSLITSLQGGSSSGGSGGGTPS